ncbi:TetR/AcrR family transcriptional regulator [Kineosporia sp. A_224]|uniref:TetR/AcrR family transcriptional regulator n=1 Tax=Kineosporia sp. A_224 TaxID=1962180 RepID=UPI000B4BE70A|nr:TetR/AcrR family transcriptional regulator [Kineosporia sp. A_224]
MPRVSSSHLAARREQIVSAALVRFARNGFHAATMADVIEESGLSAGAVYRYFRGKDELVEAICERALNAAAHSLTDLLADDEAPDPADAVAHVVDALDAAAGDGGVDLRRVQLQAWAEALRAPGVLRTATEAQVHLRRALARVVVRAQETGRLPGTLDVDAAAQVLQSLVVGRLVQDLLATDVEPGSYGEAVWTLLHPASGLVPQQEPLPLPEHALLERRVPDVAADVPADVAADVAADVERASADLAVVVPAPRGSGLGWPSSATA